MSQIVLVVAIATALLLVPSVAALLAWGLTGGDGDSAWSLQTALGLVVFVGAVYNVVTAAAAFDGIPPARWWPMWTASAAALLGVALSLRGEARHRVADLGVGVALGSSLALPAVLVLAGGGATV